MTTLPIFRAAVALTLTATCFGIALSPATATPSAPVVRIADFDLDRADDRAALEKRLKAVVRAVCATGNDSVARSVEEACIRDTLAAIAAQPG